MKKHNNHTFYINNKYCIYKDNKQIIIRRFASKEGKKYELLTDRLIMSLMLGLNLVPLVWRPYHLLLKNIIHYLNNKSATLLHNTLYSFD